jgi:hypothetical protein
MTGAQWASVAIFALACAALCFDVWLHRNDRIDFDGEA